MDVKGFAASGLAVVAAMLVFVAMMTDGWYHIGYTSDDGTLNEDFGLSKVEVAMEDENGNSSGYIQEYTDEMNVTTAGSVTRVLTVLSIVSTVAFAAGGILIGMGVTTKRKIAVIPGALCLLFLALTLLYAPFAFHDSIRMDLDRTDPFTDSWLLDKIADKGVSYSYFTVIPALPLCIAALVLVILCRPKQYAVQTPVQTISAQTLQAPVSQVSSPPQTQTVSAQQQIQTPVQAQPPQAPPPPPAN